MPDLDLRRHAWRHGARSASFPPMRDSIARGLGVLALAVVLAFAAWLYRSTLRHEPPPARSASVPLSLVDGRLVVEVTVNAPGELRFIVDTGAERSAIGSRAARRIGAPLVGRTRLVGPGGQRDVPLVSLDAVHIGGLAVRRVPALVVESAVLGDHDGILGLDVLRLFDLRIAVPESRLELVPPRLLPDAAGVPLRDVRAGIVAADAMVDGTSVIAIIDTGLPRTLLNAAAARAVGFQTGAGAVRRGLDGAGIPTVAGRIGQIALGDATLLADALVDVADAPLFEIAGLADTPALLLGADAFAGCAILIAWSARRLLPCDDAQ